MKGRENNSNTKETTFYRYNFESDVNEYRWHEVYNQNISDPADKLKVPGHHKGLQDLQMKLFAAFLLDGMISPIAWS